MTRKSAYYALAVVVLMGSMAVAALADHEETNGMYGPADSSVSSEPEQGVEQSATGEIREPMETGALPDGSVREESENILNMDVAEQNSIPELRGRPNIQEGGGGD